MNKPRMSQPLRSTPITDASSLLQAGPPACPHRYSTPRSFCCPVHSLSPPPPPFRRRLEQYRHTPSHVSCSSRRSGSRRLHAGHRLASKRAPARLFPEDLHIPRSGGPGESHPRAPTDPGVTVSRHRAPLTQSSRTRSSIPSARTVRGRAVLHASTTLGLS